MATGKTDEAMAALDRVLGELTHEDLQRRPESKETLALLCYERGKGFATQDNRTKALRWYKVCTLSLSLLFRKQFSSFFSSLEDTLTCQLTLSQQYFVKRLHSI